MPRIPLPRLPQDVWATPATSPDTNLLDPTLPDVDLSLDVQEPPHRQRVVTVTGRRGVAAVVAVGGAMALITAAVPSGAFAGGIPAVLADGAQADRADTSLAPAAAQQALVAAAPAATPAIIDVDDLVAGVRDAQAQVTAQVAAAQDAAAEQAAAAKAASDKAAADKAAAAVRGDCGLNEKGLGAVKSYVRTAAEFIGCQFGEPTMLGVGSREGASDHPSGKAVDFMVDRATGDRLAQCVLDNKRALGVTYVIWRQRINLGSGWQAMEDRGGITANHYDHVHVSFGNGAGGGALQGC